MINLLHPEAILKLMLRGGPAVLQQPVDGLLRDYLSGHPQYWWLHLLFDKAKPINPEFSKEEDYQETIEDKVLHWMRTVGSTFYDPAEPLKLLSLEEVDKKWAHTPLKPGLVKKLLSYAYSMEVRLVKKDLSLATLEKSTLKNEWGMIAPALQDILKATKDSNAIDESREDENFSLSL